MYEPLPLEVQTGKFQYRQRYQEGYNVRSIVSMAARR